MMSLAQRLLGRLSWQPGSTSEFTAPPPQPARMIDGGGLHKELAMLPVDSHALDYANKWIVQLKVDGIRALYIDGSIVTREGGPLDCALHCQPALKRLEDAFGEPMMFDGEYVEDDGFSATLSAMRQGIGNGVLWLFDAVPMSQWRGAENSPARQRLARLREKFMAADSPFVGMLDHWELSAGDAMAKARELCAEGYEGIVVKDPHAPYRRWRDDAWLRVKQAITYDGPIVDVLADGGKLKAIIVRGPEGIGPIKVGAGWTAEQGREIHDAWTFQPEGDPQLMAEISYMLSTGVKRSVRGARFVRLRWDKGDRR